jgi:hypothetical protein
MSALILSLMSKNAKHIALQIIGAIGTGLLKVILFLFWVCSSTVVTLLQELNVTIKRYLFKKE